MLIRDVELKHDSPKEFFFDKHVKFLNNYAKNKDNSYEQIMVEYLKMNGNYCIKQWKYTFISDMHNTCKKWT